MKTHFTLFLTASLLMAGSPIHTAAVAASDVDSVSIFAYTPDQRGLAFAYSMDQMTWTSIGNGHTFVSSDYGTWGAQKKMYTPFLTRNDAGKWICMWTVNNTANQFAIATSDNLLDWAPQEYPYMKAPNCLDPEATTEGDRCTIVFSSSDGTWYRTSTTDFYHFSNVVTANPDACLQLRKSVTVNGKSYSGTIVRAPKSLVDQLEQRSSECGKKGALYAERASDDAARFANLNGTVHADVEIDASQAKSISDKLVGIFFEDINYSADGGLYAELVQNRDFEYQPSDRGGDRNWNSTTAWSTIGAATLTIDTLSPIHPNNAHYALLNADGQGGGLQNGGFDGIVLKKGDKYNLSLFAHNITAQKMNLLIRLVQNGTVSGQTKLRVTGSSWKKISATFTASADADAAVLQIIPDTKGMTALDMISLFPQKTFRNRPNGLRPDLAQALADLHPKFMRFPGGCVAHGDGLANIYQWKETIGPLEERKPQRNIWGYHQSKGLGYYEFFQFCEDIGCEPLPVLAAGVCCQNSSTGGAGQQGGISMEAMPQYVQDVLDLIEWANGDANTTSWGKKRAQEGHPKPFNLKYIGIGNEDLISKVFEERYLMIVKAVKARYPDITVCGTVGPFYEGSDYDEGWRLARANHIDMVDEHHYASPAWYYYNRHFYDSYPRGGTRVYVGEYAAHVANRKNCVESALAEAMHLCDLERNGDVVSMASYAPLLAKAGHTQWNPNMIYFNNASFTPTVGYYAQQMFSLSSGDKYLNTQVSTDASTHAGVDERIGASSVTDSRTGYVYIKLVNALPCPVDASIAMSDAQSVFGTSGTTTADTTVLYGVPSDQHATPVRGTMSVSPKFSYTMPPYSFTVISIKK